MKALKRAAGALAIIPLLLLSLLITPVAAITQPYTITDLGTLPGDAESEGGGINASGQVVGLSALTSVGGCDYSVQHCDFRAFSYSDGAMTDLGYLPGGASSYGININDAGQVVGFGETSGTREQAFIYDGVTMTSLGSLPGGSRSIAYGINNDGTVVGWADTTGGLRRAFVYASGAMSDLGSLPGNEQAQAYGINNVGQIVGWSYPASSPAGDCRVYRSNCPYQAFLYDQGTMVNLGTLPGGVQSRPQSINDAGQVVGYGASATGAIRAFLYTNGGMSDLGTLGGAYALALDINASGQVVGFSETANNQPHPFIYDNGVMTDLNALLPAESGWELNYAFGINDSGQITGSGYYNGQKRAFLLTPAAQQLTALDPAQVLIGLKNGNDVGSKLDLLAEVYKDETLVSSGQIHSFDAGGSGFHNANWATIPFDDFAPVSFPEGSQLKLKVSARNACVGSGQDSGSARLWYDDGAANSRFGATIGAQADYYLRDGFELSTTPGIGPKATVVVESGAQCSTFKPFGTWVITQ